MSLNWGGFAAGITRGLDWSDRIGNQIDQAKLAKLRADGIAEAQAQRQAAINDAVKDTQAKAAEGATQPTAPTAPTTAPQTGQAAPDTADVQTIAVPQPSTAVTSQPLPPPVDSPQAAADAAPGRLPMGAAQGMPSAGAPPAPASPAAPAAEQAPQAAAAPPAPDQTATASASPMAQSVPPTAAAPAEPQKRYVVAGKGFDTVEEARAHADKVLPSMLDYQMKTLVPRMIQGYIEQGKPEEAQKLQDWSQQRDNQRHMKDWSEAVLAFQSDDFDTAAKKLNNLHKSFPDGNDIVTQEPVKDKDGNTVGFNMAVKNEQTGQTRKQYIDARQLIETGLSTLSPDKMFAAMSSRQQAFDTLKTKAAIDAENDQRTMNREVTVQNLREDRYDKRAAAQDTRAASRDAAQHGYKLEEIATTQQLKAAGASDVKKAEIQANIDTLKENGYSQDEIKGMLPALLKAGEFKKMTDPEERRAMIVTNLAKDPLFNMKSPADKKRQVDDLMSAATGDAPAPKPGTTVPNPFTPQSAPAPAAGGIPPGKKAYRDTVTGQIVFR